MYGMSHRSAEDLWIGRRLTFDGEALALHALWPSACALLSSAADLSGQVGWSRLTWRGGGRLTQGLGCWVFQGFKEAERSEKSAACNSEGIQDALLGPLMPDV